MFCLNANMKHLMRLFDNVTKNIICQARTPKYIQLLHKFKGTLEMALIRHKAIIAFICVVRLQ